MCSRDWWFSFKKKHSYFSIRRAQGLRISRAHAFNKTIVSHFFNQLEEIYPNINIKDYPQLIYNINETGLYSVPSKTNRVSATKGARAVHSIQVGERGSLTTVIPAISASGECLPPFLIFKGKKPSEEVNDQLKKHSITVTSTKSGYIDSNVFLEFLGHFQSKRIKIPEKKCILLLDGHNSHFSIEVIEFAMNNDIDMVCLSPHTSHRLQPLNTHFNKVLKNLCGKAMAEFLRSTDSSTLTRTDLVQLFFMVWNDVVVKRGLIVDAFAHCGLYPLNKQAVKEKEYSKSYSFLTAQET